MKAFANLVLIKIKLYLREPIIIFFSFLFGPLVMILSSNIDKSGVMDEIGQMSAVSNMFPAYLCINLIMSGIMTMPVTIAGSRERGEIRRFRITPLPTAVYVFADIFVYFLAAIVGLLFMIVAAQSILHVQFGLKIAALFGGYTVCLFTFFSLGYIIASLAPNARIAQVFGTIFGIPMMLFTIIQARAPQTSLPIDKISWGIPLVHAERFLRSVWLSQVDGTTYIHLTVLIVLFVVGLIVSALSFRWGAE